MLKAKRRLASATLESFNIMKTYYNGQRSRRQEGTPPGTKGEQKSVNDIRAENNKLNILQRMARNAKKNGTEDEFTAEIGETPDSILKKKPQEIPGTQRNKIPDEEIRKLGVRPDPQV